MMTLITLSYTKIVHTQVSLLPVNWSLIPIVSSASLVAQMVKSLPEVQETQGPSLGGEDPLEKEMATHSSILARKIPWTEEPDWLESMGWQSQTCRVTSLSLS